MDVISAMTDTIGGAEKVNNVLTALNLKSISNLNLKNIENHCEVVMIDLSKDLSKTASVEAFSMELRYMYFLCLCI